MSQPNLTLHLLVPGLFERLTEWNESYGGLSRFPATELLLARSNEALLGVEGFEETLCAQFSLAAEPGCDFPVGAVTRYANTREESSEFCVCADPVHLRADRDELILIDGETIGIERHEADELGALFDAHFGAESWRLEITEPARWHLILPQHEVLQTHPLSMVTGKNVRDYLPAGDRASLWHRVLNESQMLFHTASVNEKREKLGRPSINSLWIWGGGRLPQALSAELHGVWGGGALARGLALLTQVPVAALPQRFEELLMSRPAANYLLCLTELMSSVAYDDLDRWTTAMQGLETNWMGPMMAALRAGRVQQVMLYPCDGRVFTLTRTGLRKFWRRVQPLPAFAEFA